MLKKIFFAILCVGLGMFVMFFLNLKGCKQSEARKTDTLEYTKIIERPVYIADTIKVKSVAWKTKDSMIFVPTEIPCGDTAFIAQSDSVIVPSGDTLNMAFSYAKRKGNFSLVFKPRPDSIVMRDIVATSYIERPFPYGHILAALGIGILLGTYVSNK